ncbi:hypothetical protein [Xanthomonas oryzae]|nr:hypothetical protein [Xanthomonas oryzae]
MTSKNINSAKLMLKAGSPNKTRLALALISTWPPPSMRILMAALIFLVC